MASNKKKKEGDGGPGGGELTFLVTNNPTDSRSSDNKRRVRSLAALKSWPERRKKTFDQHDKSANKGGFVCDDARVTKPVPVRPKGGRTGQQAGGAKRNENGFRAAREAIRSPSFQSIDELTDEPLFETCTRHYNSNCTCVHCRIERRLNNRPLWSTSLGRSAATHPLKRSTGGTPIPAYTLQHLHQSTDPNLLTPPLSPPPAHSPFSVVNNTGRAEPFACYPVPHHPWFDRILYHMMTVFAPRGWPLLKITEAEGRHWEWFMTQHALSEPALFYVRLLFASGDLIRLRVLHPEAAFWLQSKAVAAINEALGDPARASSDPLILAVGRIALHETLYGSKEAASRIHRPAQKRMISMRGGMRALPFPELVKRLMRFTDNVMAIQSGTERLLEDDAAAPGFSMEQQVETMESWVPKEGQSLRKKIRITDLLTSDEHS